MDAQMWESFLPEKEGPVKLTEEQAEKLSRTYLAIKKILEEEEVSVGEFIAIMSLIISGLPNEHLSYVLNMVHTEITSRDVKSISKKLGEME